MKQSAFLNRLIASAILCSLTASYSTIVNAQLYDNLQAFSARLDVGDPSIVAEGLNEGPKSIVTADFDRDEFPDIAVSNLDGTVTVYHGANNGKFSPPLHLQTGARSLREVIAADFNQDRFPDLAVAAPFDATVLLFFNDGQGSFAPAEKLEAWIGARNLAAGDFDGDGVTDLAVAGPQKGLRHYRGLGDGTFTVSGDLPSLDPVKQTFPKPVYVMKAIPSKDGAREDLVVTHAESTRTWILSSQPTVAAADRVNDGSDGLEQINPPGIDPDFPVLISEFCASNDSVLADEDGEFSDWIELHNRSLETVSLNGWGLSDGIGNEARWLFPEVSLDPGHFLVVFASGKDRRDPAGKLHTNFKLSSKGEVLTLHQSNNQGFQSFPPPGAPRGRLTANSPLRITDYGFAATGSLVDDNGNKADWIRIENRGSDEIPQGEWGVEVESNGFGQLTWIPEFPADLDSGETVTIMFSGRNRRDGSGILHTSFPLELLGSAVAAVDVDGQSLHRLDWSNAGFEFPEQIGDISYGISQSGSFQYLDLPTPGWLNNAGVDSLQELPSDAGAQVSFRSTAQGTETVTAALLTDDPLLYIQYVWFCYDITNGDERHILLAQEPNGLDAPPSGIYSAHLPAGYSSGGGYRIMAAAVDLGNQQEITIELASGGATSRVDIPVQPGGLKIAAIIPGQSARALDVGSILLPASEGVLDLVTANRDTGNLEVRRGTARSGKFSQRANQIVRVPGGPRSVKIVDLNGDGWNDLVVALRNFDRIVVYRNTEGTLELASEVPTGVSPREVAVADFNGDGQPDAAAINRLSSDVSIVPAFPGTSSFSTLDQIYETDGEVVGLTVIDVTGDGRDDVVQLHRASGDVSIRTADPTGRLSEPDYVHIGTSPSAAKLIDVNGDKRLDIVTANLDTPGSISIRRATAIGYAPEERFTIPDSDRGLFALEAADFDGDGILDLAAGYFDCRLALFKGTGTGTFVYTRTTRFTYESRVMTTGDFDGDGDTDLAGAGYAGDVVVFENRGNLLTDTEAPRWDYSPRSSDKFGTREITSVDFNGDGDLDLLLGSGNGAIVYRGLAGMTFTPDGTAIKGTEYPTAGAVTGDFDGDGLDDIGVSCRLLSCVSILRGDGAGNFKIELTVDVPAGAYLAAGDLDGDGKADLVGAGDVLWTALSSRRSLPIASTPEDNTRKSAAGIVVNEILAINNDIPVESDEDKKTDWIELFNNTSTTATLGGWEVLIETDDIDFPENYRFTFPSGTSLPAGQHVLVYFSPDLRTELHTGGRLPGSGATITLSDATGTVVDTVSYPDQQPNVAYGRYHDGAESFVFNPIPSPLGANSFDGSPDPDINFKGFDYSNLRPGQPIQFHVKGKDDLGILGVSVVYQRLDVPGSQPEQFLLYDDGEHGDGGMLDGWFSGSLQPGLPPGGELQFYFVAEDLSGNVIEIPDETVFVDAGQPVRTYSIGFAGIDGPPPLSIVEVSADNKTGLTDEAGGAADYVIVRNNGSVPIALAGISLAKKFDAASDERYNFPSGGEIAAGETFIIFADGNEKQGSRHAPFKINRGGETLFLVGTAALGSDVLLDRVVTPPVDNDRILTKIADTDIWASTLPSETKPGELDEIWQGQAFSASGDPLVTVAFATRADIEYVIEFNPGEDAWVEVSRVAGDGSVSITSQVGTSGTFRVSEIRPPVELTDFHHVSANSSKTRVVVSGVLASDGGEAPALVVYIGNTDAGENPDNWETSSIAILDRANFSASLEGLTPGQPYFAKVKATNSAGDQWSTAIGFQTEVATAPELNNVIVTRPEVDGFRVEGNVALTDQITVFYGRVDGMEVPGAWEGQIPAEIDESESFFTDIFGLASGNDYFVRIRAENADSTSWTSASISAQTLTEAENLQANLLISEIMYHPRLQDARFTEPEYEYIELFNASRSAINLSDLRFVGGIDFDFSKGDVTELAAGAYGIVVANRHAFDYRYPAIDATIFGEWLNPFRQTKLANAGETLTLQFAPTGDIVHSITYDDRSPWPREADGYGGSLSLNVVTPGQNLSSASAWGYSGSELGTPGVRAISEPLIISTATGTTIAEGGTFETSVSVLGRPPLVAQWLLNDQPLGAPEQIPGSVAELRLANLTVADSGLIVLQVTNDFGTATTEPAQLTVVPRSTDPGSLDIKFTTGAAVAASDIIALPGGDVLAVGLIGTEDGVLSLAKLKSNGVVDPTFHTPIFRRGDVTSVALMDDGRIAVAGSFTRVDQIPRDGVAVLLPDGNVDKSFVPDFTMTGAVNDLLPRRDGSLIIGGSLTAQSGDATYQNLFRVLPTGRLDATFTQDLVSLVSMTSNWRFHDMGKTFGNDWRLAEFDDSKWQEGAGLLYVEQGTIDGPLNTPITLTRGATTYYFRHAMWNPFDRRIVVDLQVSYFADDGMVAYINDEEILRRRLPAGAITPGTPAAPKIINAQEEGPFIVPRVELEPGYNVVAVEVHQEAPGSSDVVFGLQLQTPETPGARSSLQSGTDGSITTIQPTRDGKMVIAGSFTSITGTIRRGIARLNADGSVDTTFLPSIAFETISDIVVQADGKVIVAVTRRTGNAIIRLRPDGNLDPTFTAPEFATPVQSMALATDGSLYVALRTAGANIVHLLVDGSLEQDFLSESANGFVNELLVHDNRITFTGSFGSIDTVPRPGIARLFSKPGATNTTLESSTDLIDWAPDPAAVIDLSAGTVHASPEDDHMLYFRLNGREKNALHPTSEWKNQFFFEIRNSP